jgi:ABC-2 type transport system permease protein
MRTILYIIQKEFLQLFRNKTLLPILFVLPVVQLVVLVNAATFEIKSTRIFMVDNDLSSVSRQLTSKFSGSKFFHMTGSSFSQEEGKDALRAGKTDVVLIIPSNFEKNFLKENKTEIQVLINGVAVSSASVINGYVNAIVQDFHRQAIQITSKSSSLKPMPTIQVIPSFWFNPDLNYIVFMLPGILVILVSVIGIFMSALVLVREKESGTIEQINVTPIKKYQFIIGKIVPFWIIAIVLYSFCLLLGRIFFNLPFEGSMPTLYLVVSIYLIVALGLGLFFASLSDTQQQVMFIAWFFMIVFILMSGLFLSTESMPLWAQRFNIINPFAYLIKVNRMILLKGSGFYDVLPQIISLSIYAVGAMSLAVWKYKKTA